MGKRDWRKGNISPSTPSRCRPPAAHLHSQAFLPDGVISAPTREVQGPLAVKHAVLHLPDIFRCGWEDVLAFAFHPVRTQGDG